MSSPHIVLLGAIAGVTIFLSLPLARMRNPAPRLKAFLNATSAGILLFLFFDVLENAVGPIEAQLHLADVSGTGWGTFAGLGAVFVAGFGFGLLSLLYLGKWQRGRRPSPAVGPGAMAVAEVAERSSTRAALQLSLAIATAIGLHNFSEGLAIGQAATVGEIQLALLLVIGFALHNSTEGFGIIGPMAAGGVRPAWSYLALLGIVGGGPTFLGTVVGASFHSPFVYVAFLAMAAGAIINVVPELLHTGRRMGAWEITLWGVFFGFLVGLATDMVVALAGG